MDPRRNGGRMNARTTEDIVEVVDFDGREWLYLRSIPVDVAIIRATTADEFGNLTSEDEGAPLGVLDQALAAHNNGGVVIAQVKRLAKGRTLPAQTVRVPGIVVDAIVVAPDQLQTTQTVLLPEAAGHYRAPISELELAPWGPEKVVARRASQELRDGEAVNLGFGISALVPRVLLEEGLDGSVTWVIEQGAVGGVPFLGFQFGCAQNPDALLASPDQFTYLQGGGFDRALLSFLEVDADGNVNVSRLNAKPHVTAGVGGFVDITARAKRIVFSGYFTAGAQLAIEDGQVRIVREGKHQRFVPEVQHVTFSGRRARELGQEVVFVTERCVIRLLPDGLTVTEIAPGISVTRDIVGQTSLDLRISPDLHEMDARLFQPEPMCLTLRERTGMSGSDAGSDAAGLARRSGRDHHPESAREAQRVDAADAGGARRCSARDRRRRRCPGGGHHGRGREGVLAPAPTSWPGPASLRSTCGGPGRAPVTGSWTGSRRSASRRSPRSTGSPTAAGSSSPWPAICGSPRTTRGSRRRRSGSRRSPAGA